MKRRQLFATIGIVTALAACAARDSWPLTAGQQSINLRRTVTHDVESHFLLFLPASFDAHSHTKYPLLIFLHGSGEAGNDLARLKVQGPPKIVEERQDFPFIVVSPQIPDEALGFDPVTLNTMLDELIARLPIDTDRVYLTGLSLGGRWTYSWATLNPERFAAIAPISGDGNTLSACRLKSVPVWAFHGAKDGNVSPQEDQEMVDAINACHGNARMTMYPDGGHDAWIPAYADPELYRWLLAHRRSTNPH